MLCMAILKTATRATDDLFIPLQEKVDRTASSNPDLHLNRATVKKKKIICVGEWSSEGKIHKISRSQPVRMTEYSQGQGWVQTVRGKPNYFWEKLAQFD